ncbi:MAG: ligand-gated channel, partial [Steroidobacteraceae bacterium]
AGDMTFSSGYFGDATNNPRSRQDSYQLYNLTARIHDESDKWEFAIIGRNLTDEYYYTTTAEVVGTGSGGGTNGPSVLADVSGVAARGREVVFRVGYKFQ